MSEGIASATMVSKESVPKFDLKEQSVSQNAISSEDMASPLSRFLLLYLNPLFQKGYLNTLNLEDLGKTAHQDTSDFLYTRFRLEFEKECLKPDKKRSLWYVLWRTVGYYRLVVALVLYGAYAGYLNSFVHVYNQKLSSNRSSNID